MFSLSVLGSHVALSQMMCDSSHNFWNATDRYKTKFSDNNDYDEYFRGCTSSHLIFGSRYLKLPYKSKHRRQQQQQEKADLYTKWSACNEEANGKVPNCILKMRARAAASCGTCLLFSLLLCCCLFSFCLGLWTKWICHTLWQVASWL